MGHGTRQRVLHQVCQQPGRSESELARALHLHGSTVAHHLHHLATKGLVVLQRQGNRLHAFPAGMTPSACALAIALRQDRAACVLTRLGPVPRALGDIAPGLGFGKSSVLWHLGRLQRLGLVVVEGRRGARTYRLAEGADAVLTPGERLPARA